MCIKTLFLDIGGVLLTNGWDHTMRKSASETFDYDWEAFEILHKKLYPEHEKGFISLDDYLNQTLFYQKRDFSLDEIKKFIYSQSKPHLDMLHLIQDLKIKFNLTIAVVSNEGRDLAEYRLHSFGLLDFVDFFIMSSFVHYQKPDLNIFKIALDVTQKPAASVFYLDDRGPLIEAASQLGIRGAVHDSFEKTKEILLSVLS